MPWIKESKSLTINAEVLGKHYRERIRPEAQRLSFEGIGRLDAYNPSLPFSHKGRRLMAVRLEERFGQVSQTRFFEEDGSRWIPLEAAATLPLEDPFVVVLNGRTYLGGVEFTMIEGSSRGRWRTLLYDIADLNAPELIFAGPMGMKDLRFCSYRDGSLGVFTRPQRGAAGRGTVGYCEAQSFAELRTIDLHQAPLIGNHVESTWEGVNQAICIDDDRVRLIGHVAWMEQGNIRHYYAARSVFHRSRGVMDPWTIILTRRELPQGPAKRPDLVDVLFPAGIETSDDGMPTLYVGSSDAECWRCPLPDFHDHEE